MKYLAPLLLIFAILTDPQGNPIWIVKSQVIAIITPQSECSPDSHAKIITGAGGFCVAEDAPDVARKVAAP